TMSVIGSNILSGASGQATGYDLEQSLRFNDADNAYLKRTISSGNRKTWTWSGWVKKSTLATGHGIFGTETSGTAEFFLMQWTGGGSGDKIFIQGYTSSSETTRLLTDRLFRDTSAWYHIVLAVDTTQATASNRLKLYVNGEQITDFTSGSQTYPNSQNLDTAINNSSYPMMVGAYSTGTPDTLDGYLAEVNFIDGQALTPASFGETDANTNQWKPIEVTGLTYGTNGFYLPFSSTELANSFTDSSKDLPSVTYPLSCDFLVIGGGGGGGNNDRSGGGGAGGYRTSAGTSGGGASAESAISLSVGKSYTVTVGAGGAANNNGSDSSIAGSGITTITSLGGGKGADANSTAPATGGSGGGGGMAATQSGASGTSSQGYAGGAGASTAGGGEPSGGGGGGAGAVGVNTASDDADGGAGGAGVSSSITGSAVTRAGGGGGGAWTNNGGAGGSGGGGAGGKQGVAGASGTANTGGGAGGGGQGGGGTGGSGIIIIRYASTTQIGTGGTVTSYTDSGTTYQVHTFTSSGTLSFGHTITANGDVANTRAELYTTETFLSGTTSWTAPAGVTSVEYLVVAGGGGGGSALGGGGGGGGFKTGTLSVTPASSYTTTVGAGGSSNTSGSDSVFGSITSTGGGKGATGGSSTAGTAGGSGGGGTWGGAGGSGSSGQGNDGGDGTVGAQGYGGGGGGSGSAGSNASGDNGGNGGNGTLAFDGYYYAGGGGGTSHQGGSGGNGGSGGAGGGASHNSAGSAGTNNGRNAGSGGGHSGSATGNPAGGAAGANTGSGGGGGGWSGGAGGAGGSGAVVIRYIQPTPGTSSIYFPNGSDYLSIPDSADWDVGTGDFTIEAWTNFTNSGADNNYDNIFKQTGAFQFARHEPSNNLYMFTGSNLGNSTTAPLADGTWRHVAVCRDSGTIYGYVNGVSVFNYSDSTDLDYASAVNIGSSDGTATWYLDELRFSNTARYPSGTTFTPSTTAFTADANTKLLIHSDFNGGLGSDSSGNKNDFALTNITASDQVLDSPTNNFCTLNSVGSFRNPDSGGTLSEGNLKFFTGTGGGAYTDTYGTFSFSSGKWYFEAVIVDKSAGMYFGITDPSVIGTANSIYPMNQASTVTWNPTESSGFIRVDASDTQYGVVCSAG
ncbi:MAG: LamG domain-containing protein, partial [Gammaproteobacteria bacterium]|nr:LamG domain-containing protein [Gammaproteobacteria bacterium]